MRCTTRVCNSVPYRPLFNPFQPFLVKRKERKENRTDHHPGEGHFDDGNKPSGTATPIEGGDVRGAGPGGRGGAKKRMRGGAAAGSRGPKKAKSTKQRLAIADGDVDA